MEKDNTMPKTLKTLLFNILWFLRDVAPTILGLLFFIFFLFTLLLITVAIIDSGWRLWISVLLALLILVALYLFRKNYQVILYKLRPATGFPPQTFPPDMYDFAEDFELGEPIVFYRGKITTALIIILVVLPFVFFFIVVQVYAIQANNFNLPSFLFLLPCLFLIYCIYILSYRVFIYTNGCVIFKNRKPTAFTWQQVDFIWQSITRTSVNGIRSTSYLYTIELSDGRRLAFGSTIQNIEELGNHLQRVISNTLLPILQSSFDRGERIDFDLVSIDKTSISFKNIQLPWQQIEDLSVRDGFVWLTQKGPQQKRLPIAQVSRIPNLLIFLTLADIARKNPTKS